MTDTRILRPLVVQLKNNEGDWETVDEYLALGRSSAINLARDLKIRTGKPTRVIRLSMVKEFKSDY